MKYIPVIIVAAIGIVSCKTTSINVAVPDQFASKATQMKVSGLNGWQFKPQINFGNYQTSKVKTGWIVSSGGNDRNSGITNEERLLKVFNMSHDNITTNSKNKFQYSIQDGNLMADIYCLEKASKEEVTTKTPLGEFSKTKNFQYSFSAAILPQTVKDEQWQLVFYNSYDRSKDTARGWFDQPNVEHEGYATNGKQLIDIRPIITDRVVGKDGKESKTLVKILMAYELKIGDGVIGVIDVFNKNVWIYNDLDNNMKLVVASISSAILLRKLELSHT
ncbi:MAG: hypothetical protein J0I41_21990 [Filimonas sp.]|nr:hypothetical protein [Filimonas sp.]